MAHMPATPSAHPEAVTPSDHPGLAGPADMRLLGLVPLAGSAGLARALGPNVRALPLGSLAALLQPEDPARTSGEDEARTLAQAELERRLSVACQAGPFLACAPDAACCAETELRTLLEGAGTELDTALARHGHEQQWDVILRWAPGPVLAARYPARTGEHAAAEAPTLPATRSGRPLSIAEILREEMALRTGALRRTLAPHVRAIADCSPATGDTECGVTVLIPAGGRQAIQTAFATLPAFASRDARCTLTGPLPALAFHTLRITRSEPGEVAAAWALLRLPERLDAADLARRWQSMVQQLEPARRDPEDDAPPLAEADAAYRLVCQEAARHAETPLERDRLLDRAGAHLALPAAAA